MGSGNYALSDQPRVFLLYEARECGILLQEFGDVRRCPRHNGLLVVVEWHPDDLAAPSNLSCCRFMMALAISFFCTCSLGS